MINSSVWYRHWLEIRFTLPTLMVAALLIGLWPGITVTGMGPAGGPAGETTFATTFEHTGPVFQAMQKTRLAQSIGEQDLFAWAVFAERISTLGCFTAALLLAGNGIMFVWSPRDASVSYTLTLPVSRVHLIWTRFVAGWLAALLAAGLALLIECAMLLVQGRGVPFVPLALSVVFSVPILMAWNAILGVPIMAIRGTWLLLIFFPLFVMSVPWAWHTVTAFPASGEVPWGALAALLGITAFGLVATILAARVKEF
jgi:hypothetical protein